VKNQKTDISKKVKENNCKELEKKLKETKQKLDDILNIINSLRDAVIFLDSKARIVYINKVLSELGGFKKEEIVGKKVTELRKMISPKSYPKIMAGLARRLAGVHTSTYEVVLKKKNGEEMNVEILGSPLYKEGKIMGSVAVLRDVTDRRKTEDELKKRNKELEKLNKIMIGREIKMIELKNRVKELEKKLS